jgi:hypothetical protein
LTVSPEPRNDAIHVACVSTESHGTSRTTVETDHGSASTRSASVEILGGGSIDNTPQTYSLLPSHFCYHRDNHGLDDGPSLATSNDNYAPLYGTINALVNGLHDKSEV